MFITQLELKNFRCFSHKIVRFTKHFVIIQGKNGSGKTSIVEALHYACYLRSFRTATNKDLIKLSSDPYFFLAIDFCDKQGDETHRIQLGFAEQEKVVKFDNKAVKSYKEIISRYRVVSLCENDLLLVQGAPEVRRTFLDQSLVLSEPSYLEILRKYRHILQQRNSLLLSFRDRKRTISLSESHTWAEELWKCGRKIQELRQSYLADLERGMNRMLSTSFPSCKGLQVQFEYLMKNVKQNESFEQFWKRYQNKEATKEMQWGRSLFGAHLDDFSILFEEKKARVYASRGQQKLVTFLIKMAQVENLFAQGIRCVLTLDDFLTDFDKQRFTECLSLLRTLTGASQVFITTPLASPHDFFGDGSGTLEVIHLEESA